MKSSLDLLGSPPRARFTRDRALVAAHGRVSENELSSFHLLVGRGVGSGRENGILTMTRRARFRFLPLLLAVVAPGAVLSPVEAAIADPYGVAVIIGNRSYTHERVPEVAYAHRDADAFRRYVIDVLGFDRANVLDLRDATQAEMESVLGNERSHQGKLWRYLHPRQGSDVVVFYSGHGVPGLKDRRGYLLPGNADPDTAEINGYPLDLLYSNLGKLEEAKSVRVYLDACFSGDSDRGMLVHSASPVYVQANLPDAAQGKLTVLAAASGSEVASWDDEARHGLFTHHLLDALHGAGDDDGDGTVTASEVKNYLDNTMTLAARREFGRIQNASLNGLTGAVLARAGAGGRFRPARRWARAKGWRERSPIFGIRRPRRPRLPRRRHPPRRSSRHRLASARWSGARFSRASRRWASPREGRTGCSGAARERRSVRTARTRDCRRANT